MVVRPLAASFRKSSTLEVVRLYATTVYPWSFIFIIRFWPMTARPINAMSAVCSMICSKPVAARQEARTATRKERLSVSSGAPAEIKEKAQRFQMPISLITCGAGVGPCARARAAGGGRQEWQRIFGKLRRESMPVLLVPRLHEDEGQFGGGFENEFAVALGAGGIVKSDELVGDDAAAAGEIGGAGTHGLGSGFAGLGAAGFAGELTDGFEGLRGGLGDEADGFAVDEDAVFEEDGLDGEILPGREADELGDFEIGGAEAVEESDEAIGVAAGDGEVGVAEPPPGWGDGPVELFVDNAAEELGVGGGTAAADSGVGAALAEEAAEVYAWIDGNSRFVHSDSSARRETYVSHRADTICS